MTNRDKALEEQLEKVMDSLARLIKGEPDRKNTRQTGPAEGQNYWFAQAGYIDSHTYKADRFDLDICTNISIYPEERFAEAERRAKKLIQAVNKRRKELNEGKEFGDSRWYIFFWESSGVGMWESSDTLYARANSHPFGLFKNSADCETCIDEFEGELEWFFSEYLPLMEELDEYDWAEAPGWREED